MRKTFIFVAAALAAISCGRKAEVYEADFETRKAQLPSEYFEVFNDSASMSPQMLQGLKFLYAYMPLPDITDYPGDYFKENVALALQAREEMPWGKTVPDREFRHFVLPVRVNNENLDGHRAVFYDELKERVKGMSMEEAILEVNHWCHEKVTYQPSDSRTHSPLASVCSAIGRCGEESTFTVAALRSIGIPARQVYTPRWAHTDDNHAWVEAWADGKWHFLGACEPEAVLDLGWFNDPASRGMLMNTRAIGRYDGPEEKLLETPMYTDINVTENYAAVDTVFVQVLAADGTPAEGAKVDFCLYNYAEFYPISTKQADAEGRASLVAGLGDLLVWATDGNAFAIQQVSVGKDREAVLTLDPQKQPKGNMHFNLTPPKGNAAPVVVDEEMAAANKRRFAAEDSMRMAYVATFVDKSRGNRATLDQFLGALPADDKARGEALLANLTDKDWTDVSTDVLVDAMVVPVQDSPLYAKYVLSPRIEREFLTPFREQFLAAMPQAAVEEYRANPQAWAKWVVDSIATDQSWQPATIRMSPWSVWQLRRTNEPSQAVFFVASARAMGIPAQIDPVTGTPQYYADGQWRDMQVSAADGASAPKGYLALTYDNSGSIDDPGYYTHFTISKIADGAPQLLNYPEEATWRTGFKAKQPIEAGEYALVSGQRLADGGVLVNMDIFDVAEGESVTMPLAIRQDTEGVKVLGSFNAENLYYDLAAAAEKSLLSTTGRGYYILGVVSSGSEPSVHALRDIADKKAELEAAGLPMVVLFTSPEDAEKCQLISGLPAGTAVGADINGAIRKELTENLKLGANLPIIVIADTFNRVVYVTDGYSIGVGQRLLDVINKL